MAVKLLLSHSNITSTHRPVAKASNMLDMMIEGGYIFFSTEIIAGLLATDCLQKLFLLQKGEYIVGENIQCITIFLSVNIDIQRKKPEMLFIKIFPDREN